MSGKKERERRREERLRNEASAEGQARRQRLIKLTSATVFLALAVVLVLIVISQSGSDGGDTNLEDIADVRAELKGLDQSGLTLGTPKAPVTLVEFGDLQCPACKSYSESIVPEVIESKVRSGEAKLEFRNFTIIGEESIDAGAAAIAAGKQGKGWEFIELFYRNQGFERSGYVTDDFLTSVARGAGVSDLKRWNADRRSKAVLAEVSQTTAQAERLALGSTPSFAIEGPATQGLEALPSGASTEALESAVDAAR